MKPLKAKSKRGHKDRKLTQYFSECIKEWNEQRYNTCIKDLDTNFVLPEPPKPITLNEQKHNSTDFVLPDPPQLVGSNQSASSLPIVEDETTLPPIQTSNLQSVFMTPSSFSPSNDGSFREEGTANDMPWCSYLLLPLFNLQICKQFLHLLDLHILLRMMLLSVKRGQRMICLGALQKLKNHLFICLLHILLILLGKMMVFIKRRLLLQLWSNAVLFEVRFGKNDLAMCILQA